MGTVDHHRAEYHQGSHSAPAKKRGTPAGWLRKTVFIVGYAAALLALAEVGSFLAIYVIDHQWYSPQKARAKRELVKSQALPRSNASAVAAVRQGLGVEGGGGEVVHPFIGYVRDPSDSSGGAVGPLGFYDSPEPAGSLTDHFSIAIFGGSVAKALAGNSETFVKVLRQSPLLRDTRIRLRTFAVAGYKQPQQLMALCFLLAVGERFDLVVNLDGFNDIALAPLDHSAGLSIFYPRGWPHRVAELPDVTVQRLVGEIAYLEHRRMQRTDWCAAAPLSFSPSCYLAWRLSNRVQGARLVALRQALLSYQPGVRSFLTHGPARQYRDEDELLHELAGLWARCSLQMHHVCTQSGIWYFHFLQPNQYVPGSKRLTRHEQLTAFDPQHRWGRYVPQGYPYLVAAGERITTAGVSFHDLRMVFADVAASVYNDTCCHYNRLGYEVLGAEMARIIVREIRQGRPAGPLPNAVDPA